MTATDALAAAVAHTVLGGGVVPCTGPEAALWTSDAASDRLLAAAACASCPARLRRMCAAVAAGERWHVWAGRDLTADRNADAAATLRHARERAAS